MPSTSQLIKLRHRRIEKIKNTTLQQGGFSLALFFSIVFFGTVFSMIYIYIAVTTNLPSIESLPNLLNPENGLLMEPTLFYDRTGNHIIHSLQNPAIEKRNYLDVVPENIKNENITAFSYHILTATIAASDPAFWTHSGFSWRGIGESQHNTIAQRLASELLLWNESPGLKRDIRERILAAQITNAFGQEQVLEWYLNSANYGSSAYGADAAAQIYFGKSASEINLAEAAILAGISESPALNPFSSPQTAIARGKIVITAMEGQGLITPAEAITATSLPITFRDPIPSQNNLAPEFIALVWQHLSRTIPIERVERGGYQIITSLDFDLQVQVNCTTRIHLSRLLDANSNQQNLQDLTPTMESCPASKLLPTLTLDRTTLPVEVSANVIVYDPISGQVLAMVAEPDSTSSNTISDGHPPGSLFTPFVYLTAFTRGFNPASLLWDIPLESYQIPAELLKQDEQYQGPLRLRNALATDTLIPAAQLINQIGIENILKIARQLGLSSLTLDPFSPSRKDCWGCSLITDGGEITLLEAVQAYGSFANQGYLVGLPGQTSFQDEIQNLTPVTVLAILDTTNQTQQAEPRLEVRPVISPQLAFLMTNILSDEAARWPSLNHPNPLEIGRPAGAKIGTTTSGDDLWTVGFTPKIVVGVWVGAPNNPSSSNLPYVASSALWHAVIKYTSQDDAPDTWPVPPGIAAMDVCDPSGMLPTLQCPSIINEIFLTGQEPTQPDSLYQVYQVNRETGRLATVFSPPEMVEERVYLNIPSEAGLWAESIGLETPPDTYDLINAPVMSSYAKINFPEMFAYLHGQIKIEGSAGGAGFQSYRIQVGEGINPSGWFVVQEDTPDLVSTGVLGTWDTSGLNGLYALQLIVLRENQQVDSATIQVTIDNTPPQIAIDYPNHLEVIRARSNETITFLIDAGDNLGLERVEYYLNGKIVAAQNQPPFAYPWNSRPGTITLLVKAIDNAGNTNETEVIFTVE